MLTHRPEREPACAGSNSEPACPSATGTGTSVPSEVMAVWNQGLTTQAQRRRRERQAPRDGRYPAVRWSALLGAFGAATGLNEVND